jgi:hypothetical protein
MTQLAKKTITIGFSQKTEDEILTPRQEAILKRKYEKAKRDFAQGRGFVAHSVDEMMTQLRS